MMKWEKLMFEVPIYCCCSVAESYPTLCDHMDYIMRAFPCGSAGKESVRNAEDLGSIPGLGRSPGEGKGYRLQYSGLENSMDCIVHGVTKSQARLSNFHFTTACQSSPSSAISWNLLEFMSIESVVLSNHQSLILLSFKF